jgi:hypothetical protein
MPDDAFKQHSMLIQDVIAALRFQKHCSRALYGTVWLLMTILCTIAQAAESAATKPATTQAIITSAPARAVRQFHDALKSANLPDAAKLLAVSPQPVRDADRRIKRLSTALAGGGWDFSILDAKESGDIAVVLINDNLKDGRKTIDIKPWYLLRQQGEWKLLGKFTDFELKEYGFDEPRIAAYRALETWSQQREPQLRKEQPDCGC